MINYSFILKFSSWNAFIVACLLHCADPEDFHVTYLSNGTARYSSRNPSITESIIASIEKHVELFETWDMANASPTEWIEKLIRENFEIPALLWEAFRIKFLRDCENNTGWLKTYSAISNTIDKSHDTKLKQIADAVTNKYWCTPMPDNERKKTVITKWIRDTYKEVSGNDADAIDHICRPEQAKKGGIKKSKSAELE